MGDRSLIEWTEATWQPITGCTVLSPGCTNCYAMRLAGTRLKHIPSRAGLTRDTKAGPVWTGEVRFNEAHLDQPLRWQRGRLIFVCAHGDLFHPAVPDEWIDRVFAVMALAPQHTFQVLTKRAERMRAYCTDMLTPTRLVDAALRLPRGDVFSATWPLPNVWLGVSAEDQRRYDERAPDLHATPAAVRFFSMEPLLGPILGNWFGDWCIVGGESGPGARPMEPDWARSLRDQAKVAGSAFFMKQMARKAPIPADLMVREWPR